MKLFPCPYLQGEVILTDEREQHITERHPDLLPQYKQCLAETLLKPLHIRCSRRAHHAFDSRFKFFYRKNLNLELSFLKKNSNLEYYFLVGLMTSDQVIMLSSVL